MSYQQPSYNPAFPDQSPPPPQPQHGFVAPPPPATASPPPPVYDPTWVQQQQQTPYPKQQPYPQQQQQPPQQFVPGPYPQQPQVQPAPPPVVVHVGATQPQQPPQPPIVTQVFLESGFGASSAGVICPNCHASVRTKVDEEAGVGAWVSCSFMFIFGCWCCCVFPFFMDDFKNHYHFCPNCKCHLGSHKGSMAC